MRIAIISDSHGNLAALDAVLYDLDRNGPYDQVMMGGDVAYGGPFPANCIERIRERGYPAVRGNTDQMIVDAARGTGDAHGNWVVEQLDDDAISYLDALPVQRQIEIDDGDVLGLVHATPWSIYDTVRPDSSDVDFRRMLKEAGTNALAYGHIHLQHQRSLESGLVIAVGSVGLPFDGDQRAMYTVIEATAHGWNIDFRRVAYDVDSTQRAAAEHGGPNAENFSRLVERATPPG